MVMLGYVGTSPWFPMQTTLFRRSTISTRDGQVCLYDSSQIWFKSSIQKFFSIQIWFKSNNLNSFSIQTRFKSNIFKKNQIKYDSSQIYSNLIQVKYLLSQIYLTWIQVKYLSIQIYLTWIDIWLEKNTFSSTCPPLDLSGSKWRYSQQPWNISVMYEMRVVLWPSFSPWLSCHICMEAWPA